MYLNAAEEAGRGGNSIFLFGSTLHTRMVALLAILRRIDHYSVNESYIWCKNQAVK
jgi:hypothetical protein